MNFSECEREPIHCPGSIQPHGVLIAVSEPSLSVLQISANAGEWLRGAAPDAPNAIGRSLDEVLGSEPAALVRAASACTAHDDNPLHLGTPTLEAPHGAQPFQLMAHRRQGVLILELEPEGSTEAPSSRSLYVLVHALMSQLDPRRTVIQVAERAVKAVRSLIGFDRVMVYRFDRDWHGEVIAEDRNDELPSYLGIHFPATDIPAQARRMYRVNRLRGIADADYTPVPLLGAPGAAPLDLTFAWLRSVSPMHTAYMKAMGTMASMSISLLQDGELWGLITCHHHTPRRISFQDRVACEMAGRLFSHKIAAAAQRHDAELRSELREREARLVSTLSCAEDLALGLLAGRSDLLACAAADGAAFVSHGECSLIGRTPTEAQVLRLAEWATEKSGAAPVMAWDALSSVLPEAEAYREVASGALCAVLSRAQQSSLIWFRSERVHTRTWAGGYPAPADDSPRPARSFELWKQLMRGRSTPWHPIEIETATNLRHAIVDVVMRIAGERAALLLQADPAGPSPEKSALLAQASHDIRVPLSTILGYTQLLQRAPNLDRRSRDSLEILLRAGEQLLGRVDELFAKLSGAPSFRAHLPPPASRPVQHLAPGEPVPRVLVADDEPSNRIWLEELLTAVGFDVRAVENGEAAAQMVRELGPDLVLMDMEMPTLDGLAAVRRIRASPGGDGPVIVMLTGRAGDADEQAARASGADAYLFKPCRGDDLLARIGELLRLRYVYADEGAAPPEPTSAAAPPVAREAIDALPEALVTRLRAALLMGDQAEISACADAIRQVDPVAGRALRVLVDGYQHDALHELLSGAPAPGEGRHHG